jgi:hypothetical protein
MGFSSSNKLVIDPRTVVVLQAAVAASKISIATLLKYILAVNGERMNEDWWD